MLELNSVSNFKFTRKFIDPETKALAREREKWLRIASFAILAVFAWSGAGL
jgi:hypothetical protein